MSYSFIKPTEPGTVIGAKDRNANRIDVDPDIRELAIWKRKKIRGRGKSNK